MIQNLVSFCNKNLTGWLPSKGGPILVNNLAVY